MFYKVFIYFYFWNLLQGLATCSTLSMSGTQDDFEWHAQLKYIINGEETKLKKTRLKTMLDCFVNL